METCADKLLALLRGGLHGCSPEGEFTRPASAAEWETLCRMASAHGVLAIAYDGMMLLPPELRPPRPSLLRWACNTEAVELRYAFQKARAAELADRFAAEGIATYVLKGMAFGVCYPRPEHRPAGDLDCFLPGACDKGNRIAREAGAEVRDGYYKHAHIRYRGLVVENHRYCLSIRGSRETKELERLLEGLLPRAGKPACVPGTRLLIPSPLFNAVLLTRHALGHFLTEGITLRHLCDWACLLAAEQERIDADAFGHICDRFGLGTFARAMTALAAERLGTPLTTWPSAPDAPADLLLADILEGGRTVFAKKGGPWQKRTMLLRNMLAGRRRYRIFYGRSMFGESLCSVWGYLTDRNPVL